MLGLIFLSEFNLLIDMKKSKFIAKVTGFSSSQMDCNWPPEYVHVTFAAESSYEDILREFSTLTSSLQGNMSVLRNVTHHI